MERDATVHGAFGPDSSSGASGDALSDADETLHEGEVDDGGWDLPLGAELGRYVLLDRIGEGAMGLVYSAYDAQLDRKLAIKIMRPHRKGHEPSSAGAARLQREAQALARLSHPNVVPIFDVGTLDHRVWVALEYVQGWTLRQWLDRRPRYWREILDVFVQAGRGLVAAHAAQLVHRDFKPDNVLVDRNGRARVTDFGLARVDSSVDSDAPGPIDTHDSLTQTLTRTGSVMGTPGYMSPEQHFGRAADGRSDQYAFCVSLFEAIYGVRPFAGKTLREVAQAKWTNTIREPKDLGRRPGGVPKALELAIRRGLASEPDQRWPTMEMLVDELDHLRRKPRTGLRVAAVALGGLVLSTWAWQAWPRACVSGQERMRGIWDDERIEQLATAFASAGTPAADEAWTNTRTDLQRFADEWTTAYESMCGAADEPAQRDAGMLCLQRRRTELRAAVEALAVGDRTTVHRASTVVDGLGSIDDCIRVDVADQPTIPADPQLAARVEAVREQLAAAAARREAGQYTVACELSRGALDDAEAIDFAPLHAEANLGLGLALGRSGLYEEAEARLVDAFYGAREQGMDHAAFDAAISLVYLVGSERERYEDALEWVRHAEAMRDRSPDDPIGRARLVENTSLVLASLERYDEAEAGYREALALRTEHGTSERAIAMLHNNYGTLLSNTRRFPEALKEHTLALELRVARLGMEHPEVAMSIINIASAHFNQFRYQEGLARLAEAEPILAATVGEEHSMMAVVHHMRGIALLRLEHAAEARASMERALAIRTKLHGADHPDIAETWNAIGASWLHDAEFDRAEAAFLRAQAIYEVRGPSGRQGLLRIQSNLGAVAARRGDYAEAERSQREVLAELERMLGKDNPELVASLQPLGLALLGLHRPGEALPIVERALRLQRIIDEDPTSVAFLDFMRLWALYDLGRDRARSHAQMRRLAEVVRAHPDSENDRAIMDAWLRDHPTP